MVHLNFILILEIVQFLLVGFEWILVPHVGHVFFGGGIYICHCLYYVLCSDVNHSYILNLPMGLYRSFRSANLFLRIVPDDDVLRFGGPARSVSRHFTIRRTTTIRE
jgi:hypothetical protein